MGVLRRDVVAAAAKAPLIPGRSVLRRSAEAIPYHEQALGIDPTYAVAHNNLGSMLIREGVPDEGLAPIEPAIQLRPAFGTAHLNRAAALLLLGRYAEARQAIAAAEAHGSSPPAAMLRMLEAAPVPAE